MTKSVSESVISSVSLTELRFMIVSISSSEKNSRAILFNVRVSIIVLVSRLLTVTDGPFSTIIAEP